MTEPQAPPTGTRIVSRLIEDEMKKAYVTYAMSVIVGRALPDIRDGLKPVHRRILYAMYDLGMLHNKAYKKSARIVGEVLGKYHPHGDTAVYDSLVRMAQDFSLRNPLIDGQGNFGSIDGDSPAAMRYTEARLNRLAEEMLVDIEKNTVNFGENFDGSLKEPLVLPSKIPNLLVNGSTGIAVGMATSIPPHNLTEVANAVCATINNPDITVEELMKIIPAPDFPTGGEIHCGGALVNAYTTGKGRVTIKAVSTVEDNKIIISEIPYMVNKEEMIEQIADLVRDKVVDGIRNINDESDQEGIRIVIDLKKDADPQVLLNQLYKHSRLRITFGITMLALVNNEPKILPIKDFILNHISHRKEVITRATQFDLDQAQKRLHILDGLLIAINNIDRVVAGIRASKNVEDAREFLISTFALSIEQAKAILDLRLQKLAALEQDKTRDEHLNLLKDVAHYNEILASEQIILQMIKDELQEVSQKFGDPRRSKIVIGGDEEGDIDLEQLIEEKEVVVTMTNSGYIKRIPVDTYKTQKRGGRGIRAAGMKDEDFIERLYICSTHDYLLYFTDRGQMHWLKVYHIPESSRESKGKHVSNLLNLEPAEKISAIIPVRDFSEGYLFMCTKMGTVKKTALSEFSRPRNGGIRALGLDEGDSLVSVMYTTGNQQIICATRNGAANRFEESDVRAMGRSAVGVRGVRLDDNDEVIGMVVADETKHLLTLTLKGYGKRTEVTEYRLCNRGGKGVININITEKNGQVATIMLVDGSEELMLISRYGVGIRIKTSDISIVGRNTQGVRVMRLEEEDSLAACAKIIPDDVEIVIDQTNPSTKTMPPDNPDNQATSLDSNENPDDNSEQDK